MEARGLVSTAGAIVSRAVAMYRRDAGPAGEGGGGFAEADEAIVGLDSDQQAISGVD